MRTTEPDPSGRRAEAALAELRAHRPQPSAQLAARVLADALAEQAALSAHAAVPPPAAALRAPRARTPAGGLQGLRRRFGAAIAGLPAPAALAASVALGVWLGVDPPGLVLTLEEALFGAVLELDLSEFGAGPGGDLFP